MDARPFAAERARSDAERLIAAGGSALESARGASAASLAADTPENAAALRDILDMAISNLRAARARLNDRTGV